MDDCIHGSPPNACVVDGCGNAPSIQPTNPWSKGTATTRRRTRNIIEADWDMDCRALGCDLRIERGDPIMPENGVWVGADHGH